ncbi:LrgB-like family-domain-containing protein [Pilobolus umbonatus]|nr:LrgB-like family-domain-containing protein [Pilobolus umbonatus]
MKINTIKNTIQKWYHQPITQLTIKGFTRWIWIITYFIVGLLFNWAVDVVLRHIPNLEQFPSNVAGMMVLYVILMVAHQLLPLQTDYFVKTLDPYSSVALQNMSVMFVPGFVIIVKNDPITGTDFGRMLCVCVVGYFIGFIVCTILVRVLKSVIFRSFQFKQPNGSVVSFDNQPTEKGEPPQKTNRNNLIIDMAEGTDDSSTIGSSTGSSIPPYPLRAENTLEKNELPIQRSVIWLMDQFNFDETVLLFTFLLCAFVFFPLPEDNPAMSFFRLFLYLSLHLLSFSFACKLPSRVTMFIHPIIMTCACVLAGIAYFERSKGFDVLHGVDLYKTNFTFIALVEKQNVRWPGAADILSAALDVAVISLAFSVYKHRPNSLKEWLILVASTAPMAFFIMMVTPIFARAIGLSPDFSLAWSARSVNTAIGIIIADVLNINQSVVTCIIVFTGIMGPLFGKILFRIARVKDDDYMTVGITMGSCSHGVGTAYLINKNPRASGMSSLAFAIFGIIGVIAVSIPAIALQIKRLAGFPV